MSRRRAASEALSSSAGIGPSLIKAEFTTQALDLILHLRQYRQMVGADENVAGVFQRSQQIERLLQRQYNIARWSRGPFVFHAPCLCKRSCQTIRTSLDRRCDTTPPYPLFASAWICDSRPEVPA